MIPRFTVYLLLTAAAAGCVRKLPNNSTEIAPLLTADKVALHSFSSPKDWDDDGILDGIETHVEAIDHFGDPCKTLGNLMFELYTFREAVPEPKGRRLGVWEASMADLREHQSHWQRISRTYRFDLQTVKPVPLRRKYILTVTMTLSDGRRLFDEREFSW